MKVKMCQLELAHVQEEEDPRFLAMWDLMHHSDSDHREFVASLVDPAFVASGPILVPKGTKSPLYPLAVSLQSTKHILGHIVRPCLYYSFTRQ